MLDYQESVTTGQTDTYMDRQMPDKVIPICRFASQATHKVYENMPNNIYQSKLQRKNGFIDGQTDRQMK